MSDPDRDREALIARVDAGEQCPACLAETDIRHYDTYAGPLHECGFCDHVWFQWSV